MPENALTATQRRERFCQIYELYLDGLSLRDIGQKLGISYERVRQILKTRSTVKEYKAIKEEADRRRSRTWETVEAINLLTNGYSCSQTAKILGVSLSSIKRLSAQYNKQKRAA